MFKKVVHPCDVENVHNAGGRYWDPIYCKVDINSDGELSISGVIGPRNNGDAWGGCGQIEMGFDHLDPAENDRRYTNPTRAEELRFAPGWDAAMWYEFLHVWHVWHLNHMRAGCEHQIGAAWDTQKQVTVTRLGPGPLWHSERQRAEDGEMSVQEYENWRNIAAAVKGAWLESKVSHNSLWTDEMRDLLTSGYLKTEKPETKNAGGV